MKYVLVSVVKIYIYKQCNIPINCIHYYQMCILLPVVVEDGRNVCLQILSIQGRIKENNFLLLSPKENSKAIFCHSSTIGS